MRKEVSKMRMDPLAKFLRKNISPTCIDEVMTTLEPFYRIQTSKHYPLAQESEVDWVKAADIVSKAIGGKSLRLFPVSLNSPFARPEWMGEVAYRVNSRRIVFGNINVFMARYLHSSDAQIELGKRNYSMLKKIEDATVKTFGYPTQFQERPEVKLFSRNSGIIIDNFSNIFSYSSSELEFGSSDDTAENFQANLWFSIENYLEFCIAEKWDWAKLLKQLLDLQTKIYPIGSVKGNETNWIALCA